MNTALKKGLIQWPFWSLIIVFAVFLQSCEKEDPPLNPFDDVQSTQDTVRFDLKDPDPNTIAGIFVNIFHPTCGNVGCHDGTFEPDFRTLESSYNTLVHQLPVKNDGNYTYRVHPGQVDKSVIMSRLHGTISPPMPIQIEPDSDWSANREAYIENIRNWIAAGAKDIMGNSPADVVHPRTRIAGVFAQQGDQKLSRVNHHGSLKAINKDEPIELFLAFRHDAMNIADLEYNRIRFSPDYNDFEEREEIVMNVNTQAVWERGMYGEIIPYFHSIMIPYEALNPDSVTQVFFRAYVEDLFNPMTEIPTNDGVYAIKEYMSIRFED